MFMGEDGGIIKNVFWMWETLKEAQIGVWVEML
jgi:hypothetical protein